MKITLGSKLSCAAAMAGDSFEKKVEIAEARCTKAFKMYF